MVIASIAILAAMLLPALAAAMARAIQTYCINNQKQLALANIMYADDFNQFIQPSAGNTGNYLGANGEWMGSIIDYFARATNMMLCPAANGILPGVGVTAIGPTAAGNGQTSTASSNYIRANLSDGTAGLSQITCSYQAKAGFMPPAAGAVGKRRGKSFSRASGSMR